MTRYGYLFWDVHLFDTSSLRLSAFDVRFSLSPSARFSREADDHNDKIGKGHRDTLDRNGQPRKCGDSLQPVTWEDTERQKAELASEDTRYGRCVYAGHASNSAIRLNNSRFSTGCLLHGIRECICVAKTSCTLNDSFQWEPRWCFLANRAFLAKLFWLTFVGVCSV